MVAKRGRTARIKELEREIRIFELGPASVNMDLFLSEPGPPRWLGDTQALQERLSVIFGMLREISTSISIIYYHLGIVDPYGNGEWVREYERMKAELAELSAKPNGYT